MNNLSERTIIAGVVALGSVLVTVMVCLTLIALKEDGAVGNTIVTALLSVISLVGSLLALLFGVHLGSQNVIQATKQANDNNSGTATGGA